MMQRRARIACCLLALLPLLCLPSCSTRGKRNQSDIISQELEENRTKSDNLRNAMRYLAQMTPLTREQTTKEVKLELNTWIQTVDPTSVEYSPPALLSEVSSEMLELVGCKSAIQLQFDYWDVDYLFERRMMQKLTQWIVDFPLRDSLIVSAVEKEQAKLSEVDAVKLEEACKLFDWAMRNIALEGPSSTVEVLTVNPRAPLQEGGEGYGYLPWETLLFSYGDFMQKGRVFNALAQQRNIETTWISVDAAKGAGKIWAIGAWIGDDLYLFETKLGMPILDPDTMELATLSEAMTNERILRRLDLPGQFDYALNPGDLKSIEFLLDVAPTALSARMKMLQNALLSDERMVLFHDYSKLEADLYKKFPGTKVTLWQVPLLAQIYASSVRERLKQTTEFTMRYMTEHGVWMLDNPAARGRLAHLYGNFENTLDTQGALSYYMLTHVDYDSIEKLAYDPATQRRLNVPRVANQTIEEYQGRVAQMQFVLSKAKVDGAMLMAQLHFDRGNFSAAETWFRKRVIGVKDEFAPLAERWHALCHYGLARIHQELGDLEQATEHLTFENSPQEPGNRLRLRYLRRMLEEN